MMLKCKLLFPQRNSHTLSIRLMQETKPPEEEPSLPNGEVVGEAQSTTEVRVGFSNHLPADQSPQNANVVLIFLHLSVRSLSSVYPSVLPPIPSLSVSVCLPILPF